MSNNEQVRTTIKYLKRLSLYNTEKPFKITFDVSEIEEAQKTNHEFMDQDIVVTDVRGMESNFTLDINGFQFCKCPTTLSEEEFETDEAVESRLYQEGVLFVNSLMPKGAEVIVLGHQRRQRWETFPSHPNYAVPLPNPVVYAHLDFTLAGADIRLRPIWEERPDLCGRRYQMINLWRVVKGPNRDWPLACCDYQTLDIDRDIEGSDVIHRTHVGENAMIYSNGKHRWYYLDNQEVDEVLLFRHCDTLGPEVPFSPHVSFDRASELDPVPGRKSIELRFVCFLDEMFDPEEGVETDGTKANTSI